MPTSRLAVAAFDTHWPKTDKPTLRALLHFLRHNKPEWFIFGGDQLDLECIAHHTKGKALYRLENAYLKDIEGFDTNVLKPVEELLPRKCKKIWHIGNHERFESDLKDEQPELGSLVNHIRLLRLEQRGWDVIPLGYSSRIGKLNIIHGDVLTGVGNQAGAFPSKKAVELYAGNVLAGHTHAPQSFTRISPVNHKQKWMGYIAPVLCNTNPSYLRNRASAWLNGMVLIEFWDNGNFNLFPCNMVNGRFAYGGRVYGS